MVNDGEWCFINPTNKKRSGATLDHFTLYYFDAGLSVVYFSFVDCVAYLNLLSLFIVDPDQWVFLPVDLFLFPQAHY